MEPVDVAFERFKILQTEISEYEATIFTEQDTRVKVIDRILTEVLAWPMAEISTEVFTGEGYVDYKLSHNGLARLILEAKRDGRELGLTTLAGGNGYKLSGPTLKAATTQEGIKQAIVYCAYKNAELACVSNGKEWLVFRGNRVGDGRDTMDGVGVVFPSLDDISKNFLLFYNLLSYESVQALKFRPIFQELEGRPIRHTRFTASLRDPERRALIPQSNFGHDVERVMDSFFQRLSGDADPDLILQCFVETSHSKHADERLARISTDFLAKVKDIETVGGEELRAIIERARATNHHAFVVIIGTKGAGKSTFIERFFKYVLDQRIRSYCLLVRINLFDSSGDESRILKWLDQRVLDKLEEAVFADKQADFSDYEGMFWDVYDRWRQGTLKVLYETDKPAFQIKFGEFVEEQRKTEPHAYVKRLLQQAYRSRKKLPVLVFDNADHHSIEFQERVFQYARSLYEEELCLIILPITDKTSWQIARQGAMRTFEHEALYLPVPPAEQVIQSRTEFLRKRIEEEEKEPGRGYFLGRGINLSLTNLKAFAFCLQEVFVASGEVSGWVSSLSNGNIRTSLEIAKEIIVSPYVLLDDLLKVFVSGNTLSIPTPSVKRALVRGRYDIFPGADSRFVRNVYHFDGSAEHSPLLGVRLLAALRDVFESNKEDTFLSVVQLDDYFLACGVEHRFTNDWIDFFLKTELCRSFDPTIIDAAHANRIEITSSGLEHLRLGVVDRIYQWAMMEITPIHDRDRFHKLKALYEDKNSSQANEKLCLFEFLCYLLEEDNVYVKIPEHEAYDCQRTLNEAIGKSVKQLEKSLNAQSVRRK